MGWQVANTTHSTSEERRNTLEAREKQCSEPFLSLQRIKKGEYVTNAGTTCFVTLSSLGLWRRLTGRLPLLQSRLVCFASHTYRAQNLLASKRWFWIEHISLKRNMYWIKWILVLDKSSTILLSLMLIWSAPNRSKLTAALLTSLEIVSSFIVKGR